MHYAPHFFSQQNYNIQNVFQVCGYLYDKEINSDSYCLNNPLKYTDPSGETWYEIDGNKTFLDDGINNMTIYVNQRQFNRLERKFIKDRNYEAYRNKMASKNGFTTFGNFGEFSQNGNGVATLPGVELAFNKPGGESYSNRQISNSTLNGIKFEVTLETALLTGAAKATMAELAGEFAGEFAKNAQEIKSLGSFSRRIGFIGGSINASISTYQAFHAPTWYQATGHGFDAGMSIIGAMGPYGFGLNLYYNNVIKNYPEIQKKH